MSKENIIDFLRVGELSNFKFGASRQSIYKILGDSTWTVQVSKSDNRPALVKYGQIEFYFDRTEDQRLYGVQITYSKHDDKTNLDVEYGELEKPLSLSNLKLLLNKNSIAFNEKTSYYDKSDNVIETQGQVLFYFDNDNNVSKFGRFLKQGPADTYAKSN